MTTHKVSSRHKIVGSSNDISTFLENRRVKCYCRRCGCKHTYVERVQKTLPYQTKLRDKRCDSCEKFAGKIHEPVEYSIGWTGGHRSHD